MAFGVKFKTAETKNAYTIEGLYEAIKDKEFSAGKPSLTKHGFTNIITFPALDRQNQVWIVPKQMKNYGKKKSFSRRWLVSVGKPVILTKNKEDKDET